jgi:uncharacterized RDD family membrane protein YckC
MHIPALDLPSGVLERAGLSLQIVCNVASAKVLSASREVNAITCGDFIGVGVVQNPARLHPYILVGDDTVLTTDNIFWILGDAYNGLAATALQVHPVLLWKHYERQEDSKGKNQHDVLEYATEGRVKICRVMDRKSRRTIIDISQDQPVLDFDEAELSPSFTFPEYQRGLLTDRFAADLIDLGIILLVYIPFMLLTYTQMPSGISLDRRVIGIYGAGYLLLTGVYFLLFMLSASQTPGMKTRQLIAVSREGTPLEPAPSCMRGLGYLISIVPLMLGFVWAVIDPEHLTWADKVSGTFLKKI